MIKEIKRLFWINRVQKLIRQYNKTIYQYSRTSRDRQFSRFIVLRNKKIELYAKLKNLDPNGILFDDRS